MRNRYQLKFCFTKEGKYVIVYDKLKKKTSNNINFPIGFLTFGE